LIDYLHSSKTGSQVLEKEAEQTKRESREENAGAAQKKRISDDKKILDSLKENLLRFKHDVKTIFEAKA